VCDYITLSMKTIAHLSVHLAEAHGLDLILKLNSRCGLDQQSS